MFINPKLLPFYQVQFISENNRILSSLLLMNKNVSDKAEKPGNIIENLINHITNFIPLSAELKNRLETICETQNFSKKSFSSQTKQNLSEHLFYK